MVSIRGQCRELTKLPAQADGPVRAEGLQQILQGGGQLVGGFIEDHGPLLLFETLQMLPAALLGGGQEALEAEPPGGLAGNAESGDGGTGAGNGTDLDSGSHALLDQILAGIGNGGTACIGDLGAGLTGQDPLYDLITFDSLVVLIVAHKAFFNAQVVQKLQGHPGILSGDEIHRFQHLLCPL